MMQRPEPPQLAKVGWVITINSGVAAIAVADTPARHHHRPVNRATSKQHAAQVKPPTAKIVCSTRAEDGTGWPLSQAAPNVKSTHEMYATRVAVSTVALAHAAHNHARQCTPVEASVMEGVSAGNDASVN